MAITRAQQAKQMLREGGRIGFFTAGLAAGDDISPGTSTSTSSGGGGGGGNNDGGSDARESYIRDYYSKGIVKGGGAPIIDSSGDIIGYEDKLITGDDVRRAREGVGESKLESLYKTGVPESNLPTVFGLGLNATKKFRDFTLRKNIDYFKGLKSRNRLEDYPQTLEGYTQYMKDRSAGLIDAAGNTIVTGGGGDNNNFIPVDTTFAQIPGDVDQAAETTEEEPFERALAFRADGGRVGAMGGGIIGGLADGNIDEMGRQMYFVGKLVKKATRAVKKIAKSPIGKIALLYTGAGALSNLAAGSGLGSMFTGFTNPSSFLAKEGLRNIFTKAGAKNILFGQAAGTAAGPFDYLQKGVPKATSGLLGFGGELSPLKAITAASVVAGALTPAQEKEAQLLADNTGIDIEEARNQILRAAAGQDDFRARAFKADGGIMRLGFDEGGKDLSTDANYKGWKKLYEKNPDAAAMNDNHQQYLNFYERNKTKQAEGSKEPVAKKTMPLLDMGGMEKDYREDGGFVPIGRMERADDVPARLSKNEFVFTADAVRNAGEGDIDKGAEVMYNMMKNLEAGGEVSEESQGLKGARRMFQTSQRLEEVL